MVYESDGKAGPLCDTEDIEYTQYFGQYDQRDVSPPDAGITFSDYEGNEYFSERGYKSKSYLSYTVNVDIAEYQVQKMNVDNLKDNIRKIETSLCYKNVSNEITLTGLK